MNPDMPNDKPSVTLRPKEGPKFLSVGKKIYIQTVNIFLPPLAHFHTKRYAGKKHHFALDTFLAILMFALAAFAIYERASIRRFFVDDFAVQITTDQPLRAGQEQELNVVLTNQTRGIFKDVQARIVPEDRFVVSRGAQQSSMAEFAAGESRSLTFRAQAYGLPQQSLSITAILTYSQDGERRGQTTRASLPITDTLLGMTVSMPTTLSSGHAGELTIAPRGEAMFRDGKIRLESSLPVSIANRKAETVYEWAVTSATPSLQATMRFSQEALGKATLTLSRHDRVNSKDVVTDRQQFEVENVQSEAKPPVIALPKASFQTYALYTDVGAGPLPPQVGLPTLYRIFLNVSDPSHELTSLTVTTSLPKGVLWAGNASARAGAAPVFDERTRRIQWVASDPANQDALEASFDVQLTPNANHIGAILPLLNEAELIYTVSGGEGSFTKASPRVTTELSNDSGSRGLGAVVP